MKIKKKFNAIEKVKLTTLNQNYSLNILTWSLFELVTSPPEQASFRGEGETHVEDF